MISLKDCKHGYTYRIRSRNLTAGVFDAQKKGFVGIREKFNHLYLFTEFHHDTGAPYGTVAPQEEIEKCPLEDIRESLGTFCTVCDRESDFRETNPEKHTGEWFHMDDKTVLCKDGHPRGKQNDKLYKYLEPITDRVAIEDLVREIEEVKPAGRASYSRWWFRTADRFKLAKLEEYCEAFKADRKTVRDWIKGDTIPPEDKLETICSYIVKKAKEKLVQG